MPSGLFLTLEGGDGAGKSTQQARLAQWLRESGREVVTTREPGGTELGQELRDIILHRRGYIAPRAEALLYAADRAHHVATRVRPALERGDIVVQDRYLDSSIAYQGAGRVLEPDEIRRVSLWAAEGLLPDLTVLLDLDPVAGSARMRSRTAWDRLESEAHEFHQRVRDGYLALAGAEPSRFLVLDASLPEDALADRIRARVTPLLDRDPGAGPVAPSSRAAGESA